MGAIAQPLPEDHIIKETMTENKLFALTCSCGWAPKDLFMKKFLEAIKSRHLNMMVG